MRKGQDRQITWLPPKQLQTAIRAQRSNCAGIEACVQAAPRQCWAEPGRRSRCCWAGLRIVAPGAPPSSATHLLFSPCHQSCGRFGWFPAPWCSVPGSQDQQEGLEAPGSSLPNWVLELLPHCLLLHYQKQILAFHFLLQLNSGFVKCGRSFPLHHVGKRNVNIWTKSHGNPHCLKILM